MACFVNRNDLLGWFAARVVTWFTCGTWDCQKRNGLWVEWEWPNSRCESGATGSFGGRFWTGCEVPDFWVISNLEFQVMLKYFIFKLQISLQQVSRPSILSFRSTKTIFSLTKHNLFRRPTSPASPYCKVHKKYLSDIVRWSVPTDSRQIGLQIGLFLAKSWSTNQPKSIK